MSKYDDVIGAEVGRAVMCQQGKEQRWQDTTFKFATFKIGINFELDQNNMITENECMNKWMEFCLSSYNYSTYTWLIYAVVTRWLRLCVNDWMHVGSDPRAASWVRLLTLKLLNCIKPYHKFRLCKSNTGQISHYYMQPLYSDLVFQIHQKISCTKPPLLQQLLLLCLLWGCGALKAVSPYAKIKQGKKRERKILQQNVFCQFIFISKQTVILILTWNRV